MQNNYREIQNDKIMPNQMQKYYAKTQKKRTMTTKKHKTSKLMVKTNYRDTQNDVRITQREQSLFQSGQQSNNLALSHTWSYK